MGLTDNKEIPQWISIHALRGEGDKHRPFRQRWHRTFQSTPSVGRATRRTWSARIFAQKISIHALRGEGDDRNKHYKGYQLLFQSTPSVGRATIAGALSGVTVTISIHALRGEGDPLVVVLLLFLFIFQSTPSVGRATRRFSQKINCLYYFNPRPPWGGRHCNPDSPAHWFYISIHALRGEGDHRAAKHHSGGGYFNPRPPWGGRR